MALDSSGDADCQEVLNSDLVAYLNKIDEDLQGNPLDFLDLDVVSDGVVVAFADMSRRKNCGVGEVLADDIDYSSVAECYYS